MRAWPWRSFATIYAVTNNSAACAGFLDANSLLALDRLFKSPLYHCETDKRTYLQDKYIKMFYVHELRLRSGDSEVTNYFRVPC